MRPLRIVVVEDSLTVREMILDALRADPGFEIVGQAGDGASALSLIERMRPDVVSLDMVLPVFSGLEVTRRVMSSRATPILIVSASANRGESFDMLDALQAGAVDVFEKSRIGTDSSWAETMKSTLRLVSRIKVVTRPNNRLPAPTGLTKVVESTPNPATPSGGVRLVVLGASTGGPAALARVLSELPKDFRLPVLAVLHLAPLFASALVDWLGRQSVLPVRLAVEGETLPLPGIRPPVILAPPDRHLCLAQGRLRLTSDPERHSCRPSVDVLFESVAIELGTRVVAGLLTGIGRDGAAGMLALRQAGAFTFAQDEASSVVYGMPREAVRLGAAQAVLPLAEIPSTLGEVSRKQTSWSDKP